MEHLMWQIAPVGMMMYCFGDLTELMLDSFWNCSKWTKGSNSSDKWFGKHQRNTCCNSSVLYGVDISVQWHFFQQ